MSAQNSPPEPSDGKVRSTLFKVLLPIAIILLLVIGGLTLLKSQLPAPSRPPGTGQLAVGVTLPDFKLTPLQGPPIQASQLKSKISLINFWATWCEACVQEMPSIVALRNTYASRGFDVVSIDVDDNPEAVVPNAVRKFGMTFPIYKDPDNKTADIFDVHAIPLTVVMNHDRKILFIESGEKDWNSADSRKQIEDWLADAK